MISAMVVGAFSTLKLKQKRKYNLSNATNLVKISSPKIRSHKNFAQGENSLWAKIRSERKSEEQIRFAFASLSLRSENFHGASLRFRSRKFQDFRFRFAFAPDFSKSFAFASLSLKTFRLNLHPCLY